MVCKLAHPKDLDVNLRSARLIVPGGTRSRQATSLNTPLKEVPPGYSLIR